MTNTTNLQGKEIKVTYNVTGQTVQGTVWEISENERFVWIENEVDTYKIDTQVTTIEVIEPEETIEHAEAYRVLEVKDAVSHIFKKIKYADEYDLKVMIYDCTEDGQQSYDVELHLTVDDEETEYIGMDVFGYEKEALKRARTIRTALAKKFTLSNKKVGIYNDCASSTRYL